jgi:predicted amidophosphoribosyltransferase
MSKNICTVCYKHFDQREDYCWNCSSHHTSAETYTNELNGKVITGVYSKDGIMYLVTNNDEVHELSTFNRDNIHIQSGKILS